MTRLYLTGLLVCGVVMVVIGGASLVSDDPELSHVIIGLGFGIPSLLLWFLFSVLVPKNDRGS